MKLSEKDEQLLSLLKLNAREPVASLARKLGVSRTTVQDRLKRLEDQKVIEGYSVKISRQNEASKVTAHISLEVEPRQAAEVSAELKTLLQIDALFSVSGKHDLLALASAASTAEMDRLLDKVGQIPGVKRTETAIVLSAKLDRR